MMLKRDIISLDLNDKIPEKDLLFYRGDNVNHNRNVTNNYDKHSQIHKNGKPKLVHKPANASRSAALQFIIHKIRYSTSFLYNHLTERKHFYTSLHNGMNPDPNTLLKTALQV